MDAPSEWVSAPTPPANAVAASEKVFVIRDAETHDVGRFSVESGTAHVPSWLGLSKGLRPDQIEFLCTERHVQWVRQPTPPPQTVKSERALVCRAANGVGRGVPGMLKGGRASIILDGREVTLRPEQVEFCVLLSSSTTLATTAQPDGATATAAEDDEAKPAPTVHQAPRDLGQGILRGVGVSAGFVGAGVASVIAAPVAGYNEKGVPGAAAGAAAGVLLGVGATVVGGLAAVASVVEGAANTPRKVAAVLSGKEWDPLGGTYEHYSLPNELARVRAVDVDTAFASAPGDGGDDDESEAPATAPPVPRCRETGLYDLLGVETTASDAQIKRAYFKRSLEMHPDRNRDDADATAKFQEIANAYQVLSTPDLRKRYDEGGAAAVSSEGMDENMALVMFTLFLGSEDFDPLIGQNPTLTAMQRDKGPDSGMSAQESAFRQLKREVECAAYLADKLQPVVEGTCTHEAFSEEMGHFALSLANTPLGLLMLRLIGVCYVQRADIYRAAPHQEPFRRLDAFARSTARSARVLSAGRDVLVKTMSAQQEAQKKAKEAKEAKRMGRGQPTEAGQSNDPPSEAVDAEGPAPPPPPPPPPPTSESSEPTADVAAPPAEASAGPSSSPPHEPLREDSEEASADAVDADDDDDDDDDDEAVNELMAEGMKAHVYKLLRLMWRMLKVDVEGVVRAATHKLLYDKSVDAATRKKRAQALRVLGNTMIMTSSAPLAKEVTLSVPPGTVLQLVRHAETGSTRLAEGITLEDGEGEIVELHAGDVLVSYAGTRLVGYAHAQEVAPALTSGQPTASVLPLTFMRQVLAGRYRTFKAAIAAQLSGGEFSLSRLCELEAVGLSADVASPEKQPRTWAEFGGRHGDESYQFGDLTKGLTKRLEAQWSRANTAEDELFLNEPEKAGMLGKRATNLMLQYTYEWHQQWYALRGNRLANYAMKEGGLQGIFELRGATISTDDFGAHQAFTITISGCEGLSKPLYLAAPSLHERLAWTAALRRAAGAGA